jgi:hypothetical protein
LGQLGKVPFLPAKFQVCKTTMLIHRPIQADIFNAAAEFKHNKGSPLACKQQGHGIP